MSTVASRPGPPAPTSPPPWITRLALGLLTCVLVTTTPACDDPTLDGEVRLPTDDPQAEEGLDEGTEGGDNWTLYAAPTWHAPACTTAALSSPAGECDGPWAYDENVYCTGVDDSCPKQCSAGKTCARWKFGVTSTGGTRSYPVTRNCKSLCLLPGDGECPVPKAEQCPPDTPARSVCDVYKDDALADVDADAVASINAEAGLSSGVRAQRIEQAKAVSSVGTPSIGAGAKISSGQSTSGGRTYIVETWRYMCTVPVTEPAPKTDDDVAVCGCKTWQPGSCKHVCGAARKFTGPGASKPAGTDIKNATCTTCDHLPFDGGTAVNNKVNCLLDGLGTVPTSVPATTWASALKARLKLLKELRGNNLSSTQHATVMGYYERGEGPLACEAPLPVTDACKAAAPPALRGRLQFCQNLARPGIPTIVSLAAVRGCFDAFGQLGGVSPTCRPTWRDATATIARDMLELRFDQIALNGSTWTGLREALDDLDAWYVKATAAAAGDATWLAAQTSAALELFWRRVYVEGYGLPDTVDKDNVDGVLAQLADGGLDVEYAVLAAAFAASSQLDTPPLLAIVGDALRATVGRLETVSELHDLACAYRPCAATSTTMTSELWRVIAALPDATALGAALQAAPRLLAAHPTIHATFTLIRDRHLLLRNAYALASGGDLAGAMTTAAPPLAAQPLVALVRQADLRYRQFTRSGLYLDKGPRTLHAGMQNKALVVSQLGTAVSTFASAYSTYLAAKLGVVAALVDQLKGTSTEDNLESQLALVNARVLDATAALAGLVQRESEEQALWADYAQKFEALRDRGVFDEHGGANTTTLETVEVRASDARKSQSDGVLAHALRTPVPGGTRLWHQPLAAGEQLLLNVSGRWSPSCALRERIFSPEVPLTGPEGYALTTSGSDFEATSNSTTTSQRLYANVEACLKAGTPATVSASSGVEAYVRACVGAELSVSDASTTSSGGEQRTTVAFQAGLRLPSTPYPDAPAGALLLVTTLAGQPAKIVDTRVLQPQSVYLASQAVDAYLVVNDKAGCDDSATDALTVSGVHIQPLASLADMATAMSEVMTELEALAPSVLAQGVWLPEEANALRQRARTRLREQLGMTTTLPPSIQEYFEAWLSTQIASLQRRAEMARRTRELEVYAIEQEGITRDIEAAGTQSRLLALMPSWQLRQLEASQLDQQQRLVMRYLRDYVPPIFALRYPDALASLVGGAGSDASAKAQLDALEALDFAAPTDSASALLLQLASKVSTALNLANQDSHEFGSIMTAVSFPNPAWLDWCALSQCEAPYWHTVDVTRAEQLWTALRTRGQVTFTIRPEDLYHPAGGSGQLTCNDAAPVIRKMALYLVNDQSIDPGPLAYRPHLEVGAGQLFPTPGAVLDFVKRDVDWLQGGVPVLGGPEIEAITDVQAHTSATGSGMSPFGSFTVDFATLPSIIKLEQDGVPLAQQVVVVFELDARSVGGAGVAIPECRP